MKILTSETPLTSAEAQTQDLCLPLNIIHQGSFSQSQCRWPMITNKCLMYLCGHSTYKMLTYLYVQTTNHYKNFTGHTDNGKCNIRGLEVVAIPREVKVQHIKGIANILVDSVSRLKAVGIYHDINSEDHQ